ncbi:MAG: hypothetical protein ACRCSZ_02270 [Lactococcus lactis]
MNRKYEDLPEKIKIYESEIMNGLKVKDLEDRKGKEFVYAVLEEMGQQCGGVRYFWPVEDKTFIFSGWLKGLMNFKLRNIVNALILVLQCKYNRKDEIVPRNAMSFKRFILDTENINLIKEPIEEPKLMLEYDHDSARERAEKARKESIEKLREVFPRFYKHAVNFKGAYRDEN